MLTSLTPSDVETLNQELSGLNAGQRVAKLYEEFGEKVVASTSFGLQASVMLQLIAEHAPKVPVVFVDTGYNFPETYKYIDSLLGMLDLNVKFYAPQFTAAQQEARWGKRWELGEEEMQKYAILNKVEPMNRAITELNAEVWLSGLRRSQSSTRANRDFTEQQGNILKAYPILDWPDAQVEHFMLKNSLPSHPLASKGYVTMGDWHSTRPMTDGVSAEETRFGGNKYECGLHIETNDSDYQI